MYVVDVNCASVSPVAQTDVTKQPTNAQDCPAGKPLFPFIQSILGGSKIGLLPSHIKGKSRVGNELDADKHTYTYWDNRGKPVL